MSFVHLTFLGHFDRDAAAEWRVVVAEPLDMTVACRLFADAGAPVGRDGLARIERDRFSVEDGYVVSRDIVRSARAAEFIADFSRVTGCEIVDWETMTVVSPDKFLSNFREMEKYRADRRRRARERRQDHPPQA